MVRCLLFLFETSSLENLSMQSFSFSLPHSLPLSCLPQHTCAVSFSSFYFLLPSFLSPFSLFIFQPLSTCILPLSSSPPPHSRATCCWCSYERFGRKRMTKADIHLCDRTNLVIMCGELLSLFYCLMELPCLAGICSHATGRDLLLQKPNIWNIASS